MSKYIDEARQELEKARIQLIEAYLNTIRKSYREFKENQRTSLESSLEKFAQGVEKGKIPKVIVPEGRHYEFNGDTARQIRVAAGLSLQELGNITDNTKSALSDWERGKIAKHVTTSERGRNYLKWLAEQGDYNPFELKFDS